MSMWLVGFSLVLSFVALTVSVINYRRAWANLRAAKEGRAKAEAYLAEVEARLP